MYPQLKKLNNESGIVLFIVLMTAIIIMIFSVGILTQSANEVNFAQQQIDQIQAEELAKGMYWLSYSSIVDGAALPPNTTFLLSGRNYVGSIAKLATTNGITSYQVVANYDTF